jgi:hypothetical protein
MKQHKRIQAMKNNVFNIVYRPTAVRILSLYSEAPNIIATNSFFFSACTKTQVLNNNNNNKYYYYYYYHHGLYLENSLLLYKSHFFSWSPLRGSSITLI